MHAFTTRASLYMPLILLASCSGASDEQESAAVDNGLVQNSNGTVEAVSAAVEAFPNDPNIAPLLVPEGDIIFKPTFELKQKPGVNEPMLRGGRVATTAYWPASFYVRFATPQGAAACTAALIGPQVMLTAAHCVPENGQVQYQFGATAYPMLCQRHGRWESGVDASADFALCQLAQPFAKPPGFKFETVDTTNIQAMAGASVILTGYGCLSDTVGQGAPDGKYRIGLNTVDQTSLSNPKKLAAKYYAGPGGQINNLITADVGANVCPGDSGGPAFRRSMIANDQQYASRKIIGVNSRVFYRDAAATTYGASMISSLGGPDFEPWARAWLKGKNLEACGLTGALPNCRT